MRLERELHEWRAAFNFVKNPNGNFAFYFTISRPTCPSSSSTTIRRQSSIDCPRIRTGGRPDRSRIVQYDTIAVSIYRSWHAYSLASGQYPLRRHLCVAGGCSAPSPSVAACSSDNRTAPGVPPDVPASLSSASLDGAIALTWTDNSYTSDPDNFQNYNVYSTSYDLDQNLCGDAWQLEGTTVAPEFVVGALTNGVPRCFSVTAVTVSTASRAPARRCVPDTPRPDSQEHHPVCDAVSGRRLGFPVLGRLERRWECPSRTSWAWCFRGTTRPSTSSWIVTALATSTSRPVRAGTGVEYYDDNDPVEDLTSIDFAADRTYHTSGILAIPGYGYVFEMNGGDGFKRYGAVRLSHVGHDFLIWIGRTRPTRVTRSSWSRTARNSAPSSGPALGPGARQRRGWPSRHKVGADRRSPSHARTGNPTLAGVEVPALAPITSGHAYRRAVCSTADRSQVADVVRVARNPSYRVRSRPRDGAAAR